MTVLDRLSFPQTRMTDDFRSMANPANRRRLSSRTEAPAMWDVRFTPDAWKDVLHYRRNEQATIVSRIETELCTQPSLEARHRKPLRPNELSTWELRIGRFRVFYNMDLENRVVTVTALAIRNTTRC
ncbi:MAG: type II toxin-antitoxin system RelE/ParE family toxin [Thermodesulfobacteriota bacterium]